MLTQRELEQLKKDISVGDMDEAVDGQAALVYYWGSKAVDSDMRVLATKASMDETEARIRDGLRSKYARSGEKVTEGTIKDMTLLDAGFKKAQQAYFAAKKDSELLDIVMKALDNKRSMLKLAHERILLRLNPEFANKIMTERINPNILKRLDAENAREALRESRDKPELKITYPTKLKIKK